MSQDELLDKRAKAYWPALIPGDSTIIYSGHTTKANAEQILDAMLAAGCTGGHIEHHIQGVGWVVDADELESRYPHAK
jgi:hypothetical protein